LNILFAELPYYVDSIEVASLKDALLAAVINYAKEQVLKVVVLPELGVVVRFKVGFHSGLSI
jgi:hypothetical protein